MSKIQDSHYIITIIERFRLVSFLFEYCHLVIFLVAYSHLFSLCTYFVFVPILMQIKYMRGKCTVVGYLIEQHKLMRAICYEFHCS
jgi:hypothetical protein